VVHNKNVNFTLSFGSVQLATGDPWHRLLMKLSWVRPICVNTQQISWSLSHFLRRYRNLQKIIICRSKLNTEARSFCEHDIEPSDSIR